MRGPSDLISRGDDLRLFTGHTWSPDERSGDRRGYGLAEDDRSALGWPDRYASSFYAGYRGRGPQNWRRPDERIREDICELMTEDEDLDPSNLEVHVKDGEVTLTGTVAGRRDKCHAERLAERVSGVVDVHNRLQLQRTQDTSGGMRQQPPTSTAMGSQTRQ
jgi:hypothetical protein